MLGVLHADRVGLIALIEGFLTRSERCLRVVERSLRICDGHLLLIERGLHLIPVRVESLQLVLIAVLRVVDGGLIGL